MERSEVAGKALGGGSSAVAASAHAACARFRGTDPLITGVTRRTLAKVVNFPDDSGRIPEARWMRAMTFERLVRDVRFASEVATTTAGRLGLARPTEVVTRQRARQRRHHGQLLADAHERAVSQRAATLIHGLAVPFVGFEETRATDVNPTSPSSRRRSTSTSGQLAGHGRRQGLRAGPVADRRRPAAQGVPAGRAGRRVCGCSGRSCPPGMTVHELRRARRPAQRLPPAGGTGGAPRRPPRRGTHARRRAAPRGRRDAVRREATSCRRSSPTCRPPSTRRPAPRARCSPTAGTSCDARTTPPTCWSSSASPPTPDRTSSGWLTAPASSAGRQRRSSPM